MGVKTAIPWCVRKNRSDSFAWNSRFLFTFLVRVVVSPSRNKRRIVACHVVWEKLSEWIRGLKTRRSLITKLRFLRKWYWEGLISPERFVIPYCSGASAILNTWPKCIPFPLVSRFHRPTRALTHQLAYTSTLSLLLANHYKHRSSVNPNIQERSIQNRPLANLARTESIRSAKLW